MSSLSNISAHSPRAAAIVGDALGDIIGKPAPGLPALTFNVTVQPSGSDVFSSASNVSFATAIAATLATPGWYEFTATTGDVAILQFAIVVWAAAVLTYEPIQRKSPASSDLRTAGAQRLILLALAQHATKAGAQATLEAGAAVAPWYGARPEKLNPTGLQSPSLRPFGGF